MKRFKRDAMSMIDCSWLGMREENRMTWPVIGDERQPWLWVWVRVMDERTLSHRHARLRLTYSGSVASFCFGPSAWWKPRKNFNPVTPLLDLASQPESCRKLIGPDQLRLIKIFDASQRTASFVTIRFVSRLSFAFFFVD